MTASTSSSIRWRRTEAKNGVEVRLISRGNEVLATRRTDAGGHVQFEAGLASGEGGRRPRCWPPPTDRATMPSSTCKAPAFDLTDRGVAGRPAPTGLDAFVYAERGVYRSGETAYLTALLRDAQGAAALDVPLTFVVERPDGVEYRRTLVADQGLGGHTLDVADRRLRRRPAPGTCAPSPIRNAPADRRDHVPGRGLCAGPDRIRSDLAERGTLSQKVPPRSVWPAASSMARRRPISISKATSPSPPRRSGAGFAGYQFGLADEEVDAVQQPLEDLPSTDAAGKAKFPVNLDKLPASTRAAGSADHGAHGGARRPRRRAQASRCRSRRPAT